MTDPRNDIRELFSHLGLNPDDYQEISPTSGLPAPVRRLRTASERPKPDSATVSRLPVPEIRRPAPAKALRVPPIVSAPPVPGPVKPIAAVGPPDDFADEAPDDGVVAPSRQQTSLRDAAQAVVQQPVQAVPAGGIPESDRSRPLSSTFKHLRSFNRNPPAAFTGLHLQYPGDLLERARAHSLPESLQTVFRRLREQGNCSGE